MMGRRLQSLVRRVLALALLLAYLLLYSAVVAVVALLFPIEQEARARLSQMIPYFGFGVALIGIVLLVAVPSQSCRLCGMSSFLDASHIQLRLWHRILLGGPALQAAWEILRGRNHCIRCGRQYP